MSESRSLVSELRPGERALGVYRVARKAFPQGKGGDHFLALTLADRTGEIEARAFDDAAKWEPLAQPNGYVRVDALAELWRGRLELKLTSLEPVPESEVRAEDFAPRSRFEPELMFGELRALVVQTRQPHLRQLLLGLLDDPEIRPALLKAPAAKSIHHAFVSGLLEHTLSVLQLGWRMCDHYPQLDRDLVTAGCLLHDLGKVRELSADPPFEYTDEGRLVGHLLITAQWIHERARRIAGFPQELEWHLTHLVAAHHGALEHGSPKLPQTLEAVVVHAVDELDSRLQSFQSLFAKDQRQGAWTDWSRIYDRPLFKGPSWDGQPLPADQRRFDRPGLYESLRPMNAAAEVPVVVEHPEAPVALPGPSADKPRPLAAWELPPTRVREYNIQYPDTRQFAPPRPAEPLDLFEKKKP